MENKHLKLGTGFLFYKTNFWRGLGSILGVDGNYYEFNTSKSEVIADKKALTSDWYNVGRDISFAKRKFEQKNKKELCL